MKEIINKNAVLNRKYYTWLVEAKGLSETTADKYMRAIYLYEDFTKGENFSNFNSDQAIKFKQWLRNRTHNGKNIAVHSIHTYLIHLRSFFQWLSFYFYFSL